MKHALLLSPGAKSKNLLLAVIYWLCGCLFFQGGVYSQTTAENFQPEWHGSKVVKDGAVLQLISKQFVFCEGPAHDVQGNVFFTDQPENKIWKYSIDGTLSLLTEHSGRANGLYLNKEGNIIACADEFNQLLSFDTSGKTVVVVNDFQGKHFNGPNDLWISKKGNIYITDPYYQRDYWTHTSPDIQKQNVYLIPKDKIPVIADSTLQKPNGIIGSPDGKVLYVADIMANKTFQYHITRKGKLIKKQIFVNLGSDGMSIDNSGNVYLTGNGVTVFNRQGKQIEHIAIDSEWTGNVTFGGKNRDELIITSTHNLYKLSMKVKGAE